MPPQVFGCPAHRGLRDPGERRAAHAGSSEMSAQATGFQPLPQAPTAIKPVINAEGVARSTWAPNVFHWVAVWRLLVVVQGFAALLLPTGVEHSLLPLQLAAAYSTLTTFLVIWPLSRRMLWPVLVVDLA